MLSGNIPQWILRNILIHMLLKIFSYEITTDKSNLITFKIKKMCINSQRRKGLDPD